MLDREDPISAYHAFQFVPMRRLGSVHNFQTCHQRDVRQRIKTMYHGPLLAHPMGVIRSGRAGIAIWAASGRVVEVLQRQRRNVLNPVPMEKTKT